MKLSEIKLIIWDLDNTLWNGILSEEKIEIINSNIEFIRATTDMGIVHSICSKNDYTMASDKLVEFGVWDFFIFPSIDWSSKGDRIKNIIFKAKLRSVNVLFIDDDIHNLEEAKHFCPGLLTIFPTEIESLYIEAKTAEHNDLKHDRLQQYHLMERKEDFRSQFSSNVEFLKSCEVKVSINNDCIKNIDRIHDLIMRSNQLNYTKNRQCLDDLKSVINDENTKSGYVCVSDKFGDYGIVGFFAILNNKAVHFAFSCRVLGMLIEQYVYVTIGCPQIEVVGDVITELNDHDIPIWINQKFINENSGKLKTKAKVLLKGPCDMSQMFSFIMKDENITTEFSYINDKGILVEGHNSSAQIMTSLNTLIERKAEIIKDCTFFDNGILYTSMIDNKYDYIVLSMLSECNLGVYQRKLTGEYISLCERYYNLTDPKNFSKYIKQEIFTSNILFNQKILEDFAMKYDFVNNSDGELSICGLQKIYEFIDSETKLILLLGFERTFEKNEKVSYQNRQIEHKALNDKIKAWSSDKANVILLPFDKYISSNNDFIDTINHFTKRVYYNLANDLVELFNGNSDKKIKIKSRAVLIIETIRQKAKILKAQLLKKRIV